MRRFQTLVLVVAAGAALSSPVKASDNAGLSACQAGAQFDYYHAIALCDQRGLGYSCQQDALTRLQAAMADCAKRYG